MTVKTVELMHRYVLRKYGTRPSIKGLSLIMSLPRAISSTLLRRLSVGVMGVLLVTGVGHAQPSSLAAGHEADAKVLPVWNTRSGQIEALLLLSQEPESDNPLDRMLPREPSLPGLGLGVSFDEGQRLRVSLSPDNNTGLALLCNQGIHVAMTLGALGQQCLLAQVGGANETLFPASRTGAKLDTNWQSANGGFDLSFGLSWIDSPLQDSRSDTLSQFGTDPVFNPALPQLLPANTGQLSQRQLHWDGNLMFGEQRWVSLGGTLGSHELDSLLGEPMRWDSTTVTLGVGFRGVSGRLTGRLIELPAGQGNVSGLDLGFSWRTPWQGELSFGAQNLLNQAPKTSKWPLSELPALEAPGGRTPYVRYKQDL